MTDIPEEPRRGSLLVIFLTVFIDLLGFGMVLPLLPIYARQFTTEKSGMLLGLLMASFSAMQFLFAPMWGRLSDRIGRRPVLMIGLGGSVLFYFLFGIATVMKSLPLLFVARIGAGIAGATISTAQAYIADTTTLQKRTKGMALIGAAFGMGFTFGPLLGYLAVPSGHGDPGPGPGYAASGLSAIALWLAYFRLPESLTSKSTSAAKKLFDFTALRTAMATPSVGPLLAGLFVCVFAFANFETTVSMLVNGEQEENATETERQIRKESPYDFDFQHVCLTYAFIGVSLTIAQGFIVRRLSGIVREGTLAVSGAVCEILGFGLLIHAIQLKSVGWLFFALTVVVMGFALMMPSLNSLISRRSDPAKQGSILGVGQSISSLARIFGGMLGIPLLICGLTIPYWTASGLMGLGLILVAFAVRGGKDFAVGPAIEQPLGH